MAFPFISPSGQHLGGWPLNWAVTGSTWLLTASSERPLLTEGLSCVIQRSSYSYSLHTHSVRLPWNSLSMIFQSFSFQADCLVIWHYQGDGINYNPWPFLLPHKVDGQVHHLKLCPLSIKATPKWGYVPGPSIFSCTHIPSWPTHKPRLGFFLLWQLMVRDPP